jgi:hypothetical protein
MLAVCLNATIHSGGELPVSKRQSTNFGRSGEIVATEKKEVF